MKLRGSGIDDRRIAVPRSPWNQLSLILAVSSTPSNLPSFYEWGFGKTEMLVAGEPVNQGVTGKVSRH